MFGLDVRRRLSAILAFVMLFSMVSIFPSYAADDDILSWEDQGLYNQCDLRDFLQEVRAFDLSEYPFDEVDIGNGLLAYNYYKFMLTFEVPVDIIDDGTDGLRYQIPRHLLIMDELYDVEFDTSDEAVVGRYSVGFDGFINTWFERVGEELEYAAESESMDVGVEGDSDQAGEDEYMDAEEPSDQSGDGEYADAEEALDQGGDDENVDADIEWDSDQVGNDEHLDAEETSGQVREDEYIDAEETLDQTHNDVNLENMEQTDFESDELGMGPEEEIEGGAEVAASNEAEAETESYNDTGAVIDIDKGFEKSEEETAEDVKEESKEEVGEEGKTETKKTIIEESKAEVKGASTVSAPQGVKPAPTVAILPSTLGKTELNTPDVTPSDENENIVFIIEFEAFVIDSDGYEFIAFGNGFEIMVNMDPDAEMGELMGLGIGIAATSATLDQSDLSNFITDVAMWDISQTPPAQVQSGGQAILGNTYRFIISFAEGATEQQQFQYNSSGMLTYLLPTALVIQNPVPITPITIADGSIVGWYTISTSGLVEMWFDNVDQYGRPSSVNYIDNLTNVTVTLELFATYTGGSLDFGNDINIGLVAIEPSPMLTMNKTSQYDPVNQRISYTITISALGGSITNIQLSDTPTIRLSASGRSLNLSNVGGPSFLDGFLYQLTQGGITGAPDAGIEVLGETTTDVTFTIDFDTALLVSLGSALTLNDGDSIAITYYFDIPNLIDRNSGLSYLVPPNIMGTNTTTSYNFFIDNSVTVTGTIADTGAAVAPITDTTSDQVRREVYILKTGQYIPPATGNTDPHIIRWTITVGDGRTAILNGGTITDTLDQTLARLQFPAANGITVTVRDNSFPTPVSKTTTADNIPTFSMTAGAPPTFTFQIPENSDLFINSAGQADGTTFGDVFQVVMTFDTIVPTPADGSATIYYNIANFEGVSSEAKVPIMPGGFYISKVTSGICGRPDQPAVGAPGISSATGMPAAGIPLERYYVDYTILVNIPAGVQGSPIYIYDTIGLGGVGAPNIPQNVSVTATIQDPSGDQVINMVQGVDFGISTEGTRFNTWRMFFGPGVTSSANSNWQYNYAVSLLIDYRVYISEDHAFNALQSMQQNPRGNYFMNTAYLYNTTLNPWETGVSTVTSAVNVTDYWPIQKAGTAAADNPALFNYTVTLWGNNSFSYDTTNNQGYWPPFLGVGMTPIFTDTFDPRMEFVLGSFYVHFTGAGGGYFAPIAEAGVSTSVDALGNNVFSVDLTALQRVSGAPPVGGWQSGGTPAPNWFAVSAQMYIYYQLVLVDATPNASEGTGSLQLTNIASIQRNGAGTCTFNSSTTKHYNAAKLAKTMTPTAPGSNRVAVEIIINPDGLTEFGAGMTGAPFTSITAVDTLSNLMLFVDSVQFQTKTMNAEGIWGGAWVDIPSSQISFNSSAIWSINPVGSSEVHFVLPNLQPVRILYQAMITLPTGVPGNINNSISLFGVTSGDGANNYVVDDGAIVAGGSAMALRIFKEDAHLNTLPLPGAMFNLYAVYMQDQSFIQPAATTTPRNITVGANTVTFYLVGGAITDSSGMAEFNNVPAINPTANLLFVLVETSAPDGYVVPAEPGNFTFFTVSQTIPADYITNAQRLFGPINQITDFLTITNELAGTLVIEKLFEGLQPGYEDLVQPITFLVQQVDRVSGTTIVQEIPYTQFIDGSFSLTPLREGRYFIQEVGGTVANHNMAVPARLPYVDVRYGQTATITITNSYTYDPPIDPTVTIRKVFHGLPTDVMNTYLTNFELSATGPAGFTPVTLNLQQALNGISFNLTDAGVPLGDYTIYESGHDNVPGFNFIGLEMGGYLVDMPFTFTLSRDESGNFFIDGIPVPSYGETLITFNNRYWSQDRPSPGSLAITKAFEGLPDGAEIEDISFLILGLDGNGYEIYRQTVPYSAFTNGRYETGLFLPAGQYTVTERGGGAMGQFNFQVVGSQQVTVVPGQTSVVDFVNSYTPWAELNVSKVFSGLTAAQLPQDFEILVTGPNDFSWVVSLQQALAGASMSVPPGDYVISERNFNVPRYNLVTVSFTATGFEPASGNSGTTYTISLTNEMTGQISIVIENAYGLLPYGPGDGMDVPQVPGMPPTNPATEPPETAGGTQYPPHSPDLPDSPDRQSPSRDHSSESQSSEGIPDDAGYPASPDEGMHGGVISGIPRTGDGPIEEQSLALYIVVLVIGIVIVGGAFIIGRRKGVYK